MYRKILVFFLILFSISVSSYGYKELYREGDFLYEVYEPDDSIPPFYLSCGLSLYFEAYLSPRLHEGISLEDMKIDTTKFDTYEQFISDMFQQDFESYSSCKRHYFQIRNVKTYQIVGLCAVLPQESPGFYYIDHVGIHKDFRRQGHASRLLELLRSTLPDWIEISLDTRVFNFPAQALYRQAGFEKLSSHPIPRKQSTYFHYVLTHK